MGTPFSTGRAIGALVAIVVACLATGCEYTEVDGIGTRTADAEHPPQHDIASFDGCEPASLDRWRARGEITNSTATVASYEVVIGFYADEVRLDERSEWIRDLRPGETAALDQAWWIDDPDRVTDCRVILINRFG